MKSIVETVNQNNFSKEDIIALLSISNKEDHDILIKTAYAVKEKSIGKKAHLRGLIELSNRCKKDCFYCGIRNSNSNFNRYSVTDEEVLQIAKFAYKNKINSIVLQAGEQDNSSFTHRITELIKKIKSNTSPDFRITLSLGEQSPETYKSWFDAGAERYLLRIESSDLDLYKKIHPDNNLHNYSTRLNCLKSIIKTGFQTGTGVMVGLPFQTVENLANDLLFLKELNIDMVGMGPYLEHKDTPLYNYKNLLVPIEERFLLTLRMIAVLRIMMPFINIVSTTALQSIVPMGRERGLKAGANVLMPNLTPGKYRKSYLLYENKACVDEDADECLDCLPNRIKMIDEEVDFIGYGDSKHFLLRNKIITD